MRDTPEKDSERLPERTTPMTLTANDAERPSTTIRFAGAKGGVGTTTVAALAALTLAHGGETVRLSATDAANVADLAHMFDRDTSPAPGEEVAVRPGITLSHSPAVGAFNVIDAGTRATRDSDGPTFLVVRNEPLSLRRAEAVEHSVDGIVVVVDHGHDIDGLDIEELFKEGPPLIAQLRVTGRVRRAVDQCGLARARSPKVINAIYAWDPFSAFEALTSASA